MRNKLTVTISEELIAEMKERQRVMGIPLSRTADIAIREYLEKQKNG